MKSKKEAIDTALRRQLEAQEQSEEQGEQWRAERGLKPMTAQERREEMALQERRKSRPDYVDLDELAEQLIRVPFQLEGFVVGWLAATGQFDDCRELLQIWLDTPKRIDNPETVDVAGIIARFSRTPGDEHAS